MGGLIMLPNLKQLVEILTYIMLLLFNIFGEPMYPQGPVTVPAEYQPQTEAPSTGTASKGLRIVQPNSGATTRSARTRPSGASSVLADAMSGLSYSGDPAAAVDEYLASSSRRHSSTGAAGSATVWDEEFVPAGTGAPNLTPLVVTLGIATVATGTWLGRRAMARRRKRNPRRAFRP
jgi:hypothetical protein